MARVKKVQGIFSWVVVLSECSHIFCCVLPSLFSLLSVFVGMGLIGVMPVWMRGLHEAMHGWEVPVMVASGLVVVLGWVLHHVSEKMDCHDTGCRHGACEPKKKNTVIILKIATFLFIINVFVYLIFHRGLENLGLVAPYQTVMSISHNENAGEEGADQH